MTRRSLAGLAMFLLIGCAAGEPNAPADISAAPPPLTQTDLLGTWNVALYFAPDQPPSATVLEITVASEDGALSGTFYGTDFDTGRYAQKDGELIISVITADGTGAYYTSGRLTPDGVITGQTLSAGRDFLMPWTAQKR